MTEVTESDRKYALKTVTILNSVSFDSYHCFNQHSYTLCYTATRLLLANKLNSYA